MTDTEKRVEEIRERVKASSNSCAHDAPGGTCCGWCRTVTLLAAYDDMKRQRDDERERAERAELAVLCEHEYGEFRPNAARMTIGGCWEWKGDPGSAQGRVRIAFPDACPICTRILGKGERDG